MSAACLRLEKSEQEKEELRRKIEEFDVRCEELLMELLEVREELKKEQRRDQNLEMEAKILARENIDLRKYLDHLEEQVVCSNCSGNLSNCSKHIHEFGERHKSRKLKLLRTRAEKALWFVESFGATLDPSVIDKDTLSIFHLVKIATKSLSSTNLPRWKKTKSGQHCIQWTGSV